MKSQINKPKLTLVGAGPGDPELITLKGIKSLQAANVVLYDALIDKSLLDYAPDARKVYVGKRSGNHHFSQDEINELIIHYALTEGHVVRLKGGDPFIFGRGSEEIEFAEAFEIETEVVPGLSSSIAVPAGLGISITKRQVSESFWVLTGTTSKGKISDDIEIAAQSTATLVILMGMNKLSEIVTIFKNAGKDDTPVAIIQNGTMADEKIGVGSIKTIVDVASENQLSSPAIIVVGEVVRHSHKLKNFYEDVALQYVLK